MVDTPEKTSGFATGNPPSASDYLLGLQGGANVKLPARGSIRTATSPVTLELSDCDGWIRVSDGADETGQVHVTIPTNANVAFPLLGHVTLECLSSGGMVIVGDTGVTLNPAATNGLAVLYQSGLAVPTKVGTDEWTVAGAQTV